MFIHCDVCNVQVATQKELEQHQEGKPHKILVAKQEQLKKLGSQSIFLDGFKGRASEEEIRQVLSTFGQVERIIVNKKNGKSAIVEFSSAEPIAKLLEQKKIQIGENKKVNLKSRQVNFEPPKESEASSLGINQINVLETVQAKLNGDVIQDLQQIYEYYRRDSTHFVDEFVTKLTAYVQGYFDNPIQIVTFGSTTTGMALFDADVDLCFVSKQHDEAASTSNGANSSTLDLMAQQITDLHNTKIPISAFNALQKTDKIKLLTRIVNELRKESGLIVSLVGVPDARCPVVRFSIMNAIKDFPKLPLNFEISVNNFLGMHKSQFVKNALNQDLSKMLFLIRLFARCSKIFKDPADATGYWSSYALSLIFVNFCQIQGYISEVKVCGPKTIKGWEVEYKIEEKPTVSCTLDEFLLEFFKFATTVFNKPIVLSPRNGRIYTQEEFKEEFKGKVADEFKFALVNIQDPIELTHNITYNVNQNYLKNLRSQSMRVICNLKFDPTQPIVAMFSKKAPRPEPSKAGDEAMEEDEPAEKRKKVN